MAQRIDLGARLRSPGRKQVSRWDGVGAVRLGMDAKDLAAQIIRVRRRFLRVPRHPAGALVDRGISRGEGIRVVPGGEVEIALSVERDRAAGVTALEPLYGDLEEHFLRCEIE